MKKNRKWKLLAFGIVLGTALGFGIPKLTNLLSNSLYQRDKLDDIMSEYLGHGKFDQLLTNETVIFAYEYNSQEPRFYSKYFEKWNPASYDLPVGNATGASSAAPAYFDPKANINKYNMNEILIDGGIICNNPAFYSYMIANYFHNQKDVNKIRILSLGTGEKPFEKVDAETMNIAQFMSKQGEFMMNMDVYTQHNVLK